MLKYLIGVNCENKENIQRAVPREAGNDAGRACKSQRRHVRFNLGKGSRLHIQSRR